VAGAAAGENRLAEPVSIMDGVGMGLTWHNRHIHVARALEEDSGAAIWQREAAQRLPKKTTGETP
jgi:hypothetical protein